MKRTKQDINDIFITACEGGVNYWARVSNYSPENGTAKLHEVGDENSVIAIHSLNSSVIRKGLKLALESEYEGIRKIAVIDIHDAIEADIIVQFGLFGEVIYG
jgi:hypothetical protein